MHGSTVTYKADGSESTSCCGAYTTYSIATGDPVLCCRACYAEIIGESVEDTPAIPLAPGETAGVVIQLGGRNDV